MEYNLPSELVKNLNFGGEAKEKVITGARTHIPMIIKLT